MSTSTQQSVSSAQNDASEKEKSRVDQTPLDHQVTATSSALSPGLSTPKTAGTKKPKVMIVFGGVSGEHGISCATANGIWQAIDRERYDVLTVGITKTGRWVPIDFDQYDLSLQADATAEVPRLSDSLFLGPQDSACPGDSPARFSLISDSTGVLGKIIAEYGPIDVAFPLLHGPFGEDGTIQGLFEMLQVPYVGCGVLASAVCMEKITTKMLLHAAGIDCGKWVGVSPRDWRFRREDVEAEIRQLRLPIFVKPSRAGSSLGVTKVNDYTDLTAAVELAQQHDPLVIVEEGLSGLEVECAVLDGRDGGLPRATVPGQIAMADQVDFYDYQTKYFGQDTVQLQIPALIDEELAAQVQEIACRAFSVLRCEGLARVDFFVDTEQRTVTVNEINTTPGFTPFSMYPKLWEASGLSYRELLSELIELARERGTGLH